MKNRFIKFLTLLTFIAPLYVIAGNPAIFSGNDVLLERQNIDLNRKAKFLTGTTDPTSVAPETAPQGSLYLRTGVSGGALYLKLDAGVSTNWSKTSGVNTGDVTLGAQTNGLSLAGQVLQLQLATGLVPGSLSAAEYALLDGAQVAVTAAASINTASTIIKRDASGNARVSNPIVASDIATKSYVDTVAAQLSPLQSVSVATTAALVGLYANGAACIGATFTMTATGVQVIDGVTLALTVPPMRVLIKNQASTFQNGVYDVTVAGALGIATVFTRSLDQDTATDLDSGNPVPVIQGTTQATTSWVQVATVTTCGTDPVSYTQWTYNPATFVQKAGDTMTGALVLAPGLVGTPSLAETGSLTTGMWFPAADTLAISTAGTEAFRILSNQTLKFSAYGLGLLHSSGAGVVTSSTLVDADVNAAAAIALTKLGTLSGYSAAAGVVASGDSVQTAIAKLDGNIAAVGSSVPVIQTKAVNYTVLSTDDEIRFSATATATLPDCTALANNKFWYIKNISNGGIITVALSGNNRFESATGDLTWVLSEPGASVKFSCNKGSILYVYD